MVLKHQLLQQEVIAHQIQALSTETETWDGTSWTVLGPANLNTGKRSRCIKWCNNFCRLAYTGESPGPPYSFYNVAEELDGSWTEYQI